MLPNRRARRKQRKLRNLLIEHDIPSDLPPGSYTLKIKDVKVRKNILSITYENVTVYENIQENKDATKQ